MGLILVLHTYNTEARQLLIPTFVNQLNDHMASVMPRTSFRSEDPGNYSCLVCIGSLLHKLTEDDLGAGSHDFEQLVPLLLPILRLCKQLPMANPLHVSCFEKLLHFSKKKV